MKETKSSTKELELKYVRRRERRQKLAKFGRKFARRKKVFEAFFHRVGCIFVASYIKIILFPINHRNFLFYGKVWNGEKICAKSANQ